MVGDGGEGGEGGGGKGGREGSEDDSPHLKKKEKQNIKTMN